MVIPAVLGTALFVVLIFHIQKDYTHLISVYSKEMGEDYDGETYYVDNAHKIEKYVMFRFWSVYMYTQFSSLHFEVYLIR